jgi:opacity protein-like surface antigen
MARRLTLFLLIAGAAGAAVLPLRAYLGTRTDWQGARDLGFGGILRSEPGPGAVFGNPALLGLCDRPAVSLTYGLGWSSEQRTRVVYDEFENAIGETVVADNLAMNGIVGPVAGVVPLFGRLGIGAGVTTAYDYGYRYFKQLRDDFYNVIGEDRVEGSGAVYDAGLGVGGRVSDWLGVGVGGGYRFGSRTLETWTIRVPDTAMTTESGKPSGIRYSAGLAVRPLAPLWVDASYAGATDLAEWRSADSLVDAMAQVQPWEARLGLRYRAPGPLPSRVMAEVSYQGWSAVDTTWSDVFTFRAGVEHLMLNSVRVRYGLGIEPLAWDPTIQVVELGAGVGFDTRLAVIDCGVRFQRDVIGPAQFKGELLPSDLDVYETNAVLAVSLSREF